MASFSANIAAYAKRTGQQIDNAVREVVLTCAALVDERSPVGQPDIWAANVKRASHGLPPLPAGYLGGHFRANNQYRFGGLPSGEIEGEDPSGSATMAKIEAEVLMSPAAGMHYIANNVPYAMALENGHSTQAPQGIYGLAAIDAANTVKRIWK